MALRIVTSRLARATAQAAPGFYAGAARHMSQETDIVKDVFVEQQKKFRALLDATKDLEIPTSGDKAAIADYAQKRYDIMKKLGIPSTEERIEMILKSGKEPGMTARGYLAFASEQRKAMGVSDESGLARALETALGEIEGKSGKPLMVDDAAGMKTLYSKVEALVKEMGLEQGDAKKESMVLEAEYEIQKLQEEVAKNKA